MSSLWRGQKEISFICRLGLYEEKKNRLPTEESHIPFNKQSLRDRSRANENGGWIAVFGAIHLLRDLGTQSAIEAHRQVINRSMMTGR